MARAVKMCQCLLKILDAKVSIFNSSEEKLSPIFESDNQVIVIYCEEHKQYMAAKTYGPEFKNDP